MAMIDYEHKHPLYQEGCQKRQIWSDLYEGGHQIRARAKTYLKQHPFETNAQYDIRVEIAAYRNFAAPVVDVFSSSINSNRPPLVIPSQLDPMRTDVDRNGTDASVFFEKITRLAAAEGVRFVLVDMSSAIGRSRKEDIDAGRRLVPYLVDLDADSVYDWGYAADGGLDWVTVASQRYMSDGPFRDVDTVKEITLWTRSEWIRYTSTDGMTGYIEAARGTHPLGIVPVVPVIFEPTTPMTGHSALDDVADLILQAYRLDSSRVKMLFDCAIPLLHCIGIDAEDMARFVRASSNAIVTGIGTDLRYVETSGASYASQREEIADVVASIREIALRQIKSPSQAVESADAKRIDRQQLDSQLVRFARLCQSAEERCWQIAAKWMGIRVADNAIKAPYTTDYSTEDAQAALIGQLMSLQSAGIIAKQTVRDADAVKALLPDGFSPEDEDARIARELSGASGPSGPSGMMGSFAQRLGLGGI